MDRLGVVGRSFVCLLVFNRIIISMLRDIDPMSRMADSLDRFLKGYVYVFFFAKIGEIENSREK